MTLCRRASAACTLSAIVRVTLINSSSCLVVLWSGWLRVLLPVWGLGPTPPPLARKPLPHSLRPKDAPIRPVSFLAADPGKAPPRCGARREAPPAVVAAGEGVLLNGPHPSRCEVRTERPTNASRSPCRHRRAHAPRRRHRTTSSRYFLYTPEMVNEQTPYA